MKAKVKLLVNLKDKVEHILKTDPATRNDDKVLAWSVWSRFCFIGDSITLEKFLLLPPYNEIVRFRAEIQNKEKKYIPTVEAVALARDWKVDDWRLALQYSERNDKNKTKLTKKGQTTIFDEGGEL